MIAIPVISDANAIQTIPCPGSFLAISSVYSPKPEHADAEVGALGGRRLARAEGEREEVLDDRRPVGLLADDPVRRDEDDAGPVGLARWRRSCRPMSRPGTDSVPYGSPAAVSSSGTGPSQSGRPVGSLMSEIGRPARTRSGGTCSRRPRAGR